MTGTERDRLLAMDDRALAAVCDFEFIKGTGNGGQKRNKTSSAVRARLRDTDFTAGDCAERSQHRNRAGALRKLRMNLALDCRAAPALPPEQARCALDHAAYPLWCARLLDVLAEADWEIKAAAETLRISPSALNKLLFRDDDLWTKANAERAARGRHSLLRP